MASILLGSDMRGFTREMIARDIANHSVFRTALHVFKYDEMTVSVFHENPSNKSFVQHFMFAQPVSSKKEAIEFIDSYLARMGTR